MLDKSQGRMQECREAVAEISEHGAMGERTRKNGSAGGWEASEREGGWVGEKEGGR